MALQKQLFLAVPFEEKESAKALGARWNSERRQWYVASGHNLELFRRWLPTTAEASPPPQAAQGDQVFQGEDRVELFVDMVPTTAWFSNLRSELKPAEWESVKKKTFRLADHRCQACSGRGPRHPVEAHERWDFGGTVQKLLRVIALCPACHETTHYGLASLNGRTRQAREQLMRVAGLNDLQANRHVREAMETYRLRSRQEWTLDARWLLDFVPLSPATIEKIQDHAIGAVQRKVQDWQHSKIGAQHRRMR